MQQEIEQFLHHELDVIGRKLEKAMWLSANKNQFLEGQQKIVLEIVSRLKGLD